jgi:hypothetical protein
MPEGVDYKIAPFARYQTAGIKLYGWGIKDGKLFKQP